MILFCVQRTSEQYWPELGEQLTPPGTSVVVSLVEVIPFPNYVIRKMMLTNVSCVGCELCGM